MGFMDWTSDTEETARERRNEIRMNLMIIDMYQRAWAEGKSLSAMTEKELEDLRQDLRRDVEWRSDRDRGVSR